MDEDALEEKEAVVEWLEGGDFLKDLAKELRDVAMQAKMTGKAGSISVCLKVTPKGIFQLEIDAKIEGKPPKPDRQRTMLYLSDDGRFHREDWKQTTLSELKEV